MSAVDRALERLDQAARFLGVLLTAAIVVILLAQIGFRYFLNSSILWSEEVATWCMVWVVFIGSASIMRRWEHVNIPLLIQVLPLRVRPVLIIFAKLATCVAVAIIAWYGVQVVMGTFHIRSQTSGINSRWIKLAVPIGSSAMALFALNWTVHDLVRWRRGDLEYFRRYGELALDEIADTASTVRTVAPGS